MKRSTLGTAALPTLLACLLAPAASASDAWSALSDLRQRLEAASPLVADFEQTFIASGFDTGDTGSGRIYLDLPACLRWDYHGEFPNSYLLCGHLAHGWNEGETSGRRLYLAEGQEPGLDLLRLEVEELRTRYQAAIGPADDEGIAVELTAGEEAAGEVRQATLVFVDGEPGLRSLEYSDVEGNRTTFVFGPYVPISDRGVFSPPADLEWLSD